MRNFPNILSIQINSTNRYYYYKYTSSLIYNVDLPGGLHSFNYRVENAMAVSNEGIELELQADILRDQPVSWRMKFNMARNWNRFEKSYTGKDINRNWIIGRPLYGLYVYAHDGFYNSEEEVPYYYTVTGEKTFYGGVSAKSLESGQVGGYKLRDFNGDGQADYYYAGSTLPLMHGGWVNEITWRNFDLNLLLNYTLGRKMVNAKIASSFGIDPCTKMLDYRDLKYWTGTNNDANLPVLGKSIVSMLDTNIEKVNYLVLRQLSLGYNIPDNLCKKIGFSGLRFFATIDNLFYLSNYSGENPEVVDIYEGVDTGKNYPLPRKWTLGLTLKFY